MKRRKILVVDDSTLLHRMYDFMLGGHDVVHAVDGVDALEKLAADPALELVFLDINMPRLDGLEVLKMIKADPQLRRLPVIMVSTHGEEQDTQRALALGADGYVKKPFRQDAIAQLIGTLSIAALTRAAE
jgi:CheY-like chemotaxis protein